MARSKSNPTHVEYFKSTSSTSSSPKWKIGLEAAELYAKYHTDNKVTRLHKIIRLLMPYRNRGTGFVALWGNVLGSISRLPVNVQMPLWNEIFDPKNQGELQLDCNQTAKAIIAKWFEMD
jgi:hypothetical protein